MDCPEQFASSVADWQEKLLQLDRRNSRLYLMPESRSFIPIAEMNADEVVELLNRKGARGASFAKGDLEADSEPLELQRRLLNLRKRAREWQDEKGVPALYLALGLLRWVDEHGEAATAPLLLLPCELTKASPRTTFRLALADVDVGFELNETLSLKLSNDLGVNLPEANSITTLSDYFSLVRRTIRTAGKAEPWAVAPRAVLGIFSYSKLAMYRDLEHLKTQGTDNRIVRALAGCSGSDTLQSSQPTIPSDSEDLSGAQLDNLLKIEDQHTVLPADYSQLIAVMHASNSDNLVVHGPPGTGKSQTITNMIATFMAEGKSVLFVSEKRAALDVVKKRLNNVGLGVFCLDLHSDRSRKANVYNQLRESLAPQTSNTDIPAIARDRALALERSRDALNNFVRRLHQPRSAIQKSVYEMLGWYATLHSVPALQLNLPAPLDTITLAWLDNAQSLLDSIAQHPEEYKHHTTSRWKVLKPTTPNISLATSVRTDMTKVKSLVDSVNNRLADAADFLGIKPPQSAENAGMLAKLLDLLRASPAIPNSWLHLSVPDLIQISDTEHETQRLRSNCITLLEQTYGSVPKWDFRSILNSINLSADERALFESQLGHSWKVVLTEKRASLLRHLKEAATIARETQTAFTELNKILALSAICSRASIIDCLEISKTLTRLAPVPEHWLSDPYDSILNALHQAKTDHAELNAAEQTLFANYDTEIVDVVDREMLVRYRTTYQDFWQRNLLSLFQYLKDRRALQECQRRPAPISLAEGGAVVQQAMRISQMRTEWEQRSAQREKIAGSRRYQNRGTDWSAIERDLAQAAELARRLGNIPSLLVQGTDPGQPSAERLLRGKVAALDEALKSLLSDDAYSNYESGRIPLSDLTASITAITPLLERIIPELDRLVNEAARKPLDFDKVLEWANAGAQLQTIENNTVHRQGSLQARFGYKYAGFTTDWSQIKSDLNWTADFLRVAPSPIPSALANHPTTPRDPDDYRAYADSVSAAFNDFYAAEADLSNYDLSFAPWNSWPAAAFDAIAEWAVELFEDADKASDWLQYRATVAELEKLLGHSAIDDCRNLTEDARIVPDAVMRSIISNWLDAVYTEHQPFSAFSSASHDAQRTIFKNADNQYLSVASEQIKERLRQRRANLQRSPELPTLRHELGKKTRQMPVRRLLETIPACIQTLKPCFLMSPLAVSQYLPIEATDENASAALTFDVVIFDEASQVFPHDAIPALLRGKQAILAGDQQQLPPSNFWGLSDNDDYDNDDDNDLKGYESILDVAVSKANTLFLESNLNTHYRSRHEDLIRFSNRHFYGDRLLTFPSPGARNDWQGVYGHFRPNALYDRGKARTNHEEALYAVDLVFKHLREHPEQSLGVAALSRQQADYIERLIQEHSLDLFFDNKPESLFVKNLENVQGDERDHIIISIGYGPSKPGERTPNTFGPILNKNGERRLNVLMTRARERMDVVYSVDPAHITSRGAQCLRQFLEYVANPDILSANNSNSSPSQPAIESPDDFREAVMRALQARGYKVEQRVGSAAYRIDLAILSEDGARYDLGIECDGSTYYSAPAARDRDWLRQSVLENLGWNIHRVWSTAWAQNPAAEIERIENALMRGQM